MKWEKLQNRPKLEGIRRRQNQFRIIYIYMNLKISYGSLTFYKYAHASEEAQREWNNVTIIPNLKKRKKRELKNHRGVSPLNT